MLKTCRYCNLEKAKNMFPKKKDTKDGLAWKCKSCVKEYNSSRPKEYTRKKSKEHYYKYKEKLQKEARERYYKNRESRKATMRKYNKNNRALKNFLESKRYTKKKNAYPKWLTKDQKVEIKRMYILASALTKVTGIQYDVDHIIPLQGKNVSGLHIPSNLQILTRAENCSKGNRF
jgi:hypothetical protein